MVHDERILGYDLGPDHPMNSKRLFPAFYLLEGLLLSEGGRASKVDVDHFENVIEHAHGKEYIKILNELSEKGYGLSPEHGLGTSDCPVWPGMAKASDFVVDSTLTLAEKVMVEGGYAFSLLGGLHHASRNQASGFCYYNDINVAIYFLKKRYNNPKIFYFDTDLHHGDGTQFEFFNDPDVLTFSIHESGKYLFPGTGFVSEIGSGEGEGSSINLPLFPYTWHNLYIELVDRYLPPIFEAFQPEFVIWQTGADGHRNDPLGHLEMSTATYNHLGKSLSKLSETMDSPRLLALGGGGYNPDNISRSWLHSLAGLTGFSLPKRSPREWVERCRSRQIVVNETLADPEFDPNEEYMYDVLSGTEELRMEFELSVGKYFSV